MMKYRAPRYHRRSTRLKGYDYSSAGFYFITICTKDRLSLFGDIIDGCMKLNAGGRCVLASWNEIPFHYPMVKVQPFVIMPNHIHGILEITAKSQVPCSAVSKHDKSYIRIPDEIDPVVGVQDFEPLPNALGHRESPTNAHFLGQSISGNLKNEYQHIIPRSIGSILRGFEIGVTKWFRKNTEIHNVWQRNYHDTIIRSERSFRIISNYIRNNPKNWEKDEFNNKG